MKYKHTVLSILSLWLALTAVVTYAAPASPPKASLAPLVIKVTPSVVNISVTTKVPTEENPLFRDPFFRRFFDLPESSPRTQMSAGSGVIVDSAQGYVLTNNHVIKNAQQISVTLKDRRTFDAKLIGTDPGTDIAVLKITPKNLTGIKLGNSEAMEVGDYVIAIGNPFGIGQTVTSGIVSALGRTGLTEEGYEDFIQTDASINPGNSGGALVNMNGELIGINTAIIGPAGGNVGIGFAVPSNMARIVMNQIIRYGEVRRGRFGVDAQDLTPEIAQALNLSSFDGAVVTQVEPGSPAEKIGIRPKDIIIELNSKPVSSAANARNRIGLAPIGEDIEIKVLRGNKPIMLKTKIAPPFTLGSIEGKTFEQLPGATFANIDKSIPMHGRATGVLVVKVDQRSPTWFAGIRPGDVIQGVNRRKVTSLQEFEKALKADDALSTMNLLRGDTRIRLIFR